MKEHRLPLKMRLCGSRSRDSLILVGCEHLIVQNVASIYTEYLILPQMYALVLRELISTFGWALTETVGRRLHPADVADQSQSSSLCVWDLLWANVARVHVLFPMLRFNPTSHFTIVKSLSTILFI